MTRPGLRRTADGDQRATSLELFYDLVFVFAVTQVSHHLLADLTWRGAGQSTLLLLVVWWSWNYTTWVTNELDPESPVVRLLMIALMLASLVMAAAIPEAFGTEAGLFVGAARAGKAAHAGTPYVENRAPAPTTGRLHRWMFEEPEKHADAI